MVASSHPCWTEPLVWYTLASSWYLRVSTLPHEVHHHVGFVYLCGPRLLSFVIISIDRAHEDEMSKAFGLFSSGKSVDSGNFIAAYAVHLSGLLASSQPGNSPKLHSATSKFLDHLPCLHFTIDGRRCRAARFLVTLATTDPVWSFVRLLKLWKLLASGVEIPETFRFSSSPLWGR